MKKHWLVLSLVLVVTIFTVGCGGSPKTSENNNNNQEVAFTGESFENSYVSFTYPKDWKVANQVEENIYTLVTLSRGDALSVDYFMIKVNKDDTTTPILDLGNQYAQFESIKGTPAELVTYGGTEYAKTAYKSGGYDQVHHIARVGNYLATITIQGYGKNLEEDKDVINMIKSIKYLK